MNQNPEAVLITGGSARIGLELAHESLDMGFHVVIHYRSSPEPAKEIFQNDKRVFFVHKELRDSPEELIDEIHSLPVQLAGLINSASVFTEGNLSDPDHLENTLNVNVLIPNRLAARFAKSVQSGWIINFTDAHVNRFSSRYQNYRISKKILGELTKQQASLLAPGIRVNAIAPGAILKSKSESEKDFSALADLIPLGRTGGVEYIRHAFRFLVENEYVTGTVIPVDGGWHLG
ncbi:MAG: SDR family oxidoreductase [Chitinispirillaceae bacterium]